MQKPKQTATRSENAKLAMQLREQKDHLARLVASSPNAIVAIDIQGNVTEFNDRAQEILGYTADEVLGKPTDGLYWDTQTPHEIGKLLQIAPDGKLTRYTTFARAKDRRGGKIPIIISATLLYNAEGHRVGSVAHIEDLSYIGEKEQRIELLLRASNIVARAENLGEALLHLAQMIGTLLPVTFCRILLRDQSESFFVVRVAYPIFRERELKWKPGLGEHISVHEWPISHRLLEEGNPSVFRWNDKEDRHYLETLSHGLGLEQDIQSLLIIPLKISNKIVGLLELGEQRSEARSPFTDKKIELVTAIAAQTAILIDRMILYEITKRHIEELENLHYATRALAEATDQRDVLQTVVTSVCKVLRADSAVIWPYDKVRNRFIPEEYVTFGIPNEESEKLNLEESEARRTGYTVMQRGWVGVSDISSSESEFLSQPTRDLIKHLRVRSFQGIALNVGDEPVGVLYINYKQPQKFLMEDRRALENFAAYAALALKRSRLLEQVYEAKRATKMVAQVTALGDVQATLSFVVRGTKETMGCDAVTLFVYDQTTGKFNFPPAIAGELLYPKRVLIHEISPNSIVYSILQRDEPYVVERISEDVLFKDMRFSREEKIESCVAIPLMAAGQKVGVMFVNYRIYHHFSTDELTDIQLFANQAAVAIRNSQLYQELQRRANTLLALYKAGQTIISTLSLEEILNRIVEQALQVVGGGETEGCFSSLALVDRDKLHIVAASPSKVLLEWQKKIGDIDLDNSRQIGITGRAVMTRQLQYVADVIQDPDYIAFKSHTRSELAVPITIGSQVIGIINLEHPSRNAFDEEDMRAVEALSTQAAIAIQNAQQYQELKKTKGLVGARTALAWMGMASNAWRHAIQGYAITIKDLVERIRKDLGKRAYSNIETSLKDIEELATKVIEKPITAPLSMEEAAESVVINSLLQERMKQLWESEPYKSVKYKLSFNLEDSITVRASSEWLKRAIDVLIDNAVDAMQESDFKHLTLKTRSIDDSIEISITDTGKGIPADLLPKLLHEPIRKFKGSKGLGMGLLMAQSIVQTYGGEIRVGSAGQSGTTMILRFPSEV